jgi:hypothetical protein
MGLLLAVALMLAGGGAEPLSLAVSPDRGALRVGLRLNAPLPEAFVEALPTGAQVRVRYQLQVRARRTMWWDRKVWRGTVRSVTAFDPLTGRWRCELTLDDVVVVSDEVESAEAARVWLTEPPAVRLVLPHLKRSPRLYVRARAVFQSSTTWLVFPSIEGTDWIEMALDQPQ